VVKQHPTSHIKIFVSLHNKIVLPNILQFQGQYQKSEILCLKYHELIHRVKSL
jgi:hypothetical protein